MKAERYQITVRGLIDANWSAYFAGMAISAGPNGMTRFSGEIADQSALYGLLNKIRDLNLKIISLQLLAADGVSPLECHFCPLNKPGDTSLDS
jgi:hypothetical protein